MYVAFGPLCLAALRALHITRPLVFFFSFLSYNSANVLKKRKKKMKRVFDVDCCLDLRVFVAAKKEEFTSALPKKWKLIINLSALKKWERSYFYEKHPGFE